MFIANIKDLIGEADEDEIIMRKNYKCACIMCFVVIISFQSIFSFQMHFAYNSKTNYLFKRKFML